MQSESVLLNLTNQLAGNAIPSTNILGRCQKEKQGRPTADRIAVSSKQRQRGRKQVLVDMKIWGPWTKYEKLAFLEGLRRFGHGNWKQISSLIETRDITQVKSHAQYIRKKYANGEYIFTDLDMHYYYGYSYHHGQRTPSLAEYIVYRNSRSPRTSMPNYYHPKKHPLDVRSPSQVLVAACALVQLGSSKDA